MSCAPASIRSLTTTKEASMAAPAQDKYFLRSLHQEIDLFDRKLAHMLRYDSFASDNERKASANKLQVKRDSLARTARKLVEDGIEFKASELPRSFRGEEVPSPEVGTSDDLVTPAEDTIAPAFAAKSRTMPSPYAGTIFDVQADVQAYKRNRVKSQRAQA